MWKYVLPPVLFVAILWVSMSTVTTLYMNWVEYSYDHVIQENLASIQHADGIQDCLKRFAIILPADDRPETSNTNATRMLPFWRLIDQELDSHRLALQQTAHSQAELDQMKLCSQLIDVLRKEGNQLFAPDLVTPPTQLEQTQAQSTAVAPSKSQDNPNTFSAIRQRLTELANQIDSSMVRIKQINRELADASASSRGKWGKWVRFIRGVFLIAGPLLGIYFGWQLARRLQKSVTKIAVTMKQVDNQTQELGEVTIQPLTGELGSMQHQAEAIVQRLRQVHEDLDRTKREAIRSERLSSVGRLAASVAHELRNPLTSVKLLLQNALRRGQTELLNQDKLELILDEVSRMESTIEGLLDFSRVRPLQSETHEVHEIIQRAFNLVSGQIEQTGIEILFEKPHAAVLIHVDKELVHQVFVNLFLNAIDSMPQGGTLKVVVALKDAERVSISFLDTGPGIANEILECLFEPFATTKERGTGLGLAISRQIIDQHSGLLTAENALGGGALFTILLPLAHAIR